MKVPFRGAAATAIGFTVGLVASFLVQWSPGTKAPSIGTVDPTSVKVEEPAVKVNVEVSDRDADKGWVLMASEEIARDTPPEDIKDCHALHAWALKEGALPAGDVGHKITVSANFATTIESTLVWVESDSTPYPGDAPIVRLVCLPAANSSFPLLNPELPRLRVNSDSSPMASTHSSIGLPDRRKVDRHSAADLDVVIDLAGASGPFAYRISVEVREGGQLHKVPVNGAAAPFFATEDGGGMGYSPAVATWTMSPARTRTYCPPVSGPSQNRKTECS